MAVESVWFFAESCSIPWYTISITCSVANHTENKENMVTTLQMFVYTFFLYFTTNFFETGQDLYIWHRPPSF